ncbi:MAG: hypothetical protein IIZ46_07255 [Clostridia bacterium]|nr:hypothetical protein [Clostridia bacterium]
MASQINPENGFRKTMRTVDFFTVYFDNFKKLVLTNLLFVSFLLPAVVYITAITFLTKGFSLLSAAACIIILNVGMGGVAQVCRYIYTKKDFNTVKTFFKGVLDNYKRCLLHGVILYLFFVFSYSSIVLYYSGTKTNGIFWVPLVITSLISLLMLFASYYANIMTVTIDISLKNIYRNCALFSFGELKNNLLATLALIFFAAVIFTVTIFFKNPLFIILSVLVLSVFIIPSTIQYILTFYVYDSMINILDESRKNDNKNENEEIPRNSAVKVSSDEAEQISEAIDDDKNDEYIFHNGRMIKRSAVLSQLNNGFDDE